MRTRIFFMFFVSLMVFGGLAECKHRVKRHEKKSDDAKKGDQVDKVLELVKKDKILEFIKRNDKEDTEQNEVAKDKSPKKKADNGSKYNDKGQVKENTKDKKETSHHNYHHDSQKRRDTPTDEKKALHLPKAENPFFDFRNNKDMLVSGLVSKVPICGRPSSPADIQDMDIYFYDTVPSEMYLKPASFKGKKETPKWVSHSIRSPFQKAFEIAMLKFNVGLDEAEIDDNIALSGSTGSNKNNFYYNPNVDEPAVVGQRSIVMVEGNPNSGNSKYGKYDRTLEKNYFCPVHALQKTILSEPFEVDSRDSSVPLVSLPMGQQMVQVCSCQLMKKQPSQQ